MPRLREAVIVEGRCDKAKLAQILEDTPIIETGGFRIFKDKENLELIRRLAKERGVVVFTDSDGAGFLIRSRLSQCLPPDRVKHAYIPDVYGKERRKRKPSKEGKLGVEGMPAALLLDCLRRARAMVEEAPSAGKEKLSKSDLAEHGLSGGADSAGKRRALQKRLGLPERLSANGLLQALNALYTREEALEAIVTQKGEDSN